MVSPTLQAVATELRGSYSKLQVERMKSKCIKPHVITMGTGTSHEVIEKESLAAQEDPEHIQALFPATYGQPRVELLAGPEEGAIKKALRIGVVLSGGQAPGGHNVIAGIFDYVTKCNKESKIIGFLNGPKGVMTGVFTDVTDDVVAHYRNTGGFDMLGSGRDKIETHEQMQSSMDVCQSLKLDGLIVIGGDDSNTNAAILAEYFKANGCKTNVCGCPKTIDGDLKNEYIPISFGFDTASKTFSEEIGNVMQDALASQKYYHFIRLMGRAASNIALECALQTRPNVCLISEEIQEKGESLMNITREIADMVVERAQKGKNYGVVTLPEGLIEFIPEFTKLIENINDVLAGLPAGTDPSEEAVVPLLQVENATVFNFLPRAIKLQLLMDRDPHGNVQVAMIETERMLAETVSMELERRHKLGQYTGKFVPQFHSFGYEGRCSLPSHFDCSYSYSLGYTAGALIANGRTSLMASVQNLQAPIEEWTIGGVPITMMCHMEQRHGKPKPVIKKALVDLEGAPFKAFASQREKWMLNDFYRAPGPIQFYSDGARDVTMTLLYELLGEAAQIYTHVDFPLEKVPKSLALGPSKMNYRPVSVAMRSKLEQSRLAYYPKVPPGLAVRSVAGVQLSCDEPTQCAHSRDRDPLQRMFPHTYGKPLLRIGAGKPEGIPAAPGRVLKVGVVFSGRQSAGGHNIIWGLQHFLKGVGGKVLGFVGGTTGLFEQSYVEITEKEIAAYKNQGGFDLLGRTVDKLRDESELAKAAATCKALELDGLVMVGSNRTQTDAAYLAEHFKAIGVNTCVVGVPCGISGGMKNHFVETAAGFDTAVKVYSQLAGNTAIDAASARKYWYFMRLMGQSPSHITLETALQMNPNVCLLAEEVAAKRWSLYDVVREIADSVQERAADDRNFGTVLIPEGLIKAIPEMDTLMMEIDSIYEESGQNVLSLNDVQERLTRWSSALLQSLPLFIQQQVCLERQSNHKVQLGQIETEKMLVYFVEEELKKRKAAGLYKGKFSAVCSYLGYQARSALPSNFDCDLAYCLGGVAATLVHRNLSGYLAIVTGLKSEVHTWQAGAVPLTSMLVDDNVETLPTGQARPRIPPCAVNLNGPAIQKLRRKMQETRLADKYRNPGPIQFAGDTADSCLIGLALETDSYFGQIGAFRQALAQIEEACRPGCSTHLLKISTKAIQNLVEIMALQEQK